MNKHSIIDNYSFDQIESFLVDITESIVNCPTNISHFVGFNEYNYNKEKINRLKNYSQDLFYLPQHIILPDYSIKVINGLLSSQEVKFFENIYSTLNKQTMASYAIQSKFGSDDNGIRRASFYNYELAFYLFSKIFPNIDKTKIIDGEFYIACQLNPLLRFIEYRNNNSLVPHHDTAVRINNNIISASSIVLYFTNNVLGKTRLISENLADPRNIQPSEILYEVSPQEGKCMIFDHNIFHDSSDFHQTYSGEKNKLVITTEVLYYKLSKQQIDFLSIIT